MTRTLLAAGAAALACAAGAAAGVPPPGATARCNDGTYSFSQHRSGTCSHHGGVAQWLTGGAVAVGATVLLGPRTRSAHCTLGPRPDRACSPGAYSAGLTVAALCSPAFRTGSIRNVPESEKHAVEVEYGLAPRAYGSALEIDHVVPLELGGSNDVANLFPQRAPGYRAKDRLENVLHDEVCGGRIALRTAQRQIALDWQGLYRELVGVAP